MSILKYVLKKNIITISYQTPLLQIVKIINDKGENQTLIDIKNSYINCICVVEKSKFLGILRPENIIKLITSIPDWRGINAGKLMCHPVINLTQSFDVKLAFSLMQKHHINHLPIVDESGNFLGIATSENIAELLQAQLLETEKQLQDEIQHRYVLQVALAETQTRKETALGNNQYLLNVSDNGVGITKDYFNQEHSIGLQLVWNLVEQIEGSISCDTTSGTSFNITFFEQN